MIDPELRGPAFFARLMLLPWPWWFRLMANASKRDHGKNIEELDCSEIQLPRREGAGTIRTRLYKPPGATGPLPILLYLHGGGYFMGSPEMFGDTIKAFIKTRPCVVVSPDYRKSLEAPYPAAIDDCYDALLWVKHNAEAIGGRSDQIMVGGHSAGGGLTAAVSQRARDRGDVRIAFQMPIYPMIDDRNDTPSARDNDAPLWNAKLNALGWRYYLSGLHARNAPIPADAAPARATDYSNLPPTLTFVADLDPFCDETAAYVEHLKQAGVPVEFRIFKGGFHGSEGIAPKARISREAINFLTEGFARAVDTRFAPQDS
ncbi:MAG: alpha/beta hydrolase [Hyphomonadaceae bacterium]|nr:alpha/beta hydrolase [Hyphomonadaceae bacterium]